MHDRRVFPPADRTAISIGDDRSSETAAVTRHDDESNVELKRVVSFPWLLLFGLGSTVGAGIYILIGAVAGRAGAQAPWAFLIASIVAAFTALSMSELSARFPKAGGAVVYVQNGLRLRAIALAVAVGTISAGTISAAAVSRGFAAYLSDLVQVPDELILTAVVVGVGAIAAWGVKESIVAAGVITLIEVGGILAVLVAGGIHLATDDAAAVPSGAESGAWTTATLPVFSTVVLCFYAFLGFEDMVNVAEEVKDPSRTMPRAILATLGISTALYVLLAAVSVRVVPPEELGQAAAPLSLVFERSGGPSELLSLIALVAMLNGALVQVIMASRVLFSIARDGSLPKWVAIVHPRTRTPIAATLVITTGVGFFVALLPIERLAAMTASVALSVFAVVNLSLVAIHWRESADREASAFRVHRGIPICGAVVSLVFLGIELWTSMVTS